MILLYNTQNLPVGTYKDFEGLCDYFRRLEYFKDPSPSPNTVFEGSWNFIYHPHKRLSALFGYLKEDAFTKQEQEAYENDLDLIEIYTGNSQPFRQIIVTPDVDVARLMRDWCFDYCYANHYVLFEVITGGLCCELPVGNEKQLHLTTFG